MAGKKLTNGLNIARLDQLILDLGVRVRVWKSTLCPNLKSLESMDHSVNCQLCSNNMIDFCPTETMALFQQQELIEQYKLQGTFHMDEILVTFKSGTTLQHYSKVELLDFTEDFFELIVRQEGSDIDVLKYPAKEVLGAFAAVNNTTKERYYVGTDFEIDVNGNIKWIGPHKPADRKVYSVYYRHCLVYRAIKAVHRDRFTQFNLRGDKIESPKVTIEGKTYVKAPETWIIKRDYLLERKDRDGNVIPKNEDYDPNE
jgi:hypothetical protein